MSDRDLRSAGVMPQRQSRPDRERVERNIYRRRGADDEWRFEIGYRDSDGRQRWQVVEGGVTAARAALHDVKARQGRGERVAPNPRLTFAEAAEQWWAAQAEGLRPSTRAAYRSSLDTHLLPVWGRRRLDSIDVDQVAKLIATMRTAAYRREVETRLRAKAEASGSRKRTRRPPRDGEQREGEGGYRAWTVRGALTPAGRVFDYARRRMGWAGQNPVRLLDRSERPRSDQRERRVLTGAELGRLLARADGRHQLIFSFAAGTGARLGEVLGVRWWALDFDAGTVELTHQSDRHGRYVELKTARSRRTIELPTQLVHALREHKAESGHSRPDDYVFAAVNGRALEHRNVAGRALARAVKAAGLDGSPRFTFHGFRHGFASAWIASGGDPVELSSHLGHRDLSVTTRIYAHDFERSRRSEARRTRLDGLYGSAVEATNGSGGQNGGAGAGAEIADLQAIRGRGQ